MSRARTIRLVVTAATAAIAMTACGALTPGSDSNNDSNNDSGTAGTGGPVSTEVPDEQVTLTMAFVDGPEMVDQLIAAFEEEHPNVTIEPQFTEFTDYIKSIKLSMTSDTAPDIAQYNPGPMKDLVASGHILDLDPYKDAYGWDEKFPGVSLEQLTSDETGKVYGTGNQYAIPGGLSLTGIFYNKELAAQAGIDVPPATLDEFEQALATAKDAGLTPVSIGALDSGGAHMWAALLNVMMNTDDYRGWVFGEQEATLATDDALAATEKFAEWAELGYFNESANGMGQEDSTAQFVNGSSVFLMNGNWAAAQVAAEMGDNAGFFLVPGTEPDAPATGSGFSVSYSVSAQTEQPEAAAAFLDFLVSPEATQIISDGGFLPPNTEAAPDLDGVLGDLSGEFARVMDADGLNVYPDFAAPAAFDAMTSGVQSLIAGRMEPQVLLDDLQEIRDEYLAE